MRTVEEIERADRTLAKDLKAMLADKECYGEMTGYQVTTVDFLADILDGISDKRLAEICAAEKDGRCWTAPCKVGDTVYEPCSELPDFAFEYKITDIFYQNSRGRVQIRFWAEAVNSEKDDLDFFDDDFGKTVFLTRPEAIQVGEGKQ